MIEIKNYDPKTGERILVDEDISEKHIDTCPHCGKSQDGIYCSECGDRLFIEEIDNAETHENNDGVFGKVLGFFGIKDAKGKK
ncbi:MAG: hypothetical protein Q4P34_02790 [Tissierellia bacterium]|nr:hypothetical protein [Tissierellia bacterium]